MQKLHSLQVSYAYHTTPAVIYETFTNGKFFKLTGADKIHFDLIEGGDFSFLFKDRGMINGTFLKIVPEQELTLNWNVTGFGRPDENNTLVHIRISPDSRIEIRHEDIREEEAMIAKTKAWQEIVTDLEKELA